MRKSYDYLSITYMSFTSPLLNVWKFFGKLKKKHPRVQKQTFQQVSKFFWKSSEIFRSLRKKSENVAKYSKKPSGIFYFFKKNLQKLLEVFGKNQKMSESSQNDLPTIFVYFQKCLENFGNPQKIFECDRRFLRNF